MLLDPKGVKSSKKVKASEEFVFHQQVVPGVMFGIGTHNKAMGSTYSPHSPYFFLDEDALLIGATLHTAIVE
nr:IAA-amino acid hydrolase ILR1-like 5 [Tanacetum cinerariifolium]